MSRKIIITSPEKEQIVELLQVGYQITISDIQSRFPQFSLHVIRNNINEWGLSHLLFKGCKDSTKQKLSDCNKGKHRTEEEKLKIGIGCKKAMRSRTEESWRQSYQKAQLTLKQNYGSVEESYKQRHEKGKQTKLERYGDMNYNNEKKGKQTKLDRYGDENYNNRAQASETCIALYGGVGNASPISRQKQEETMLQKYGVTHNWSSKDPALNGRKTMFENAGSKEQHYQNIAKKGKQTKLQLYGDQNYNNSLQIQQTMLERYGCRYYVTTPACRKACATLETSKKRYQTMKKNGTLITSNQEDAFFPFLQEQFGQNDVLRQYSDDRYPFACDFYIPSKDLFIECHFGWRHMGHPYDENSEEDQKTLHLLQEKAITSGNYKNAIYQWTILDPKKVSTAYKNNVNLIVIYSEDEYYDYDI